MREIRPSGLTRGEAAELPPLSYSPGPHCIFQHMLSLDNENGVTRLSDSNALDGMLPT